MGRGRRRPLTRNPRADELDAVAAFIATLQARPEARNAFFGDTAEEVAVLLASWDTAWVESSRVADRDGRIVGFLGAELDESLGRVWIHGPLVDDADWDHIADALLTALMAEVPAANAKDQELAGDVANERTAAFAARHGFVAGKVHHVLSLAAPELERPPVCMAMPLRLQQREAFVALHEELFPGTYYSGRQLIDQAAEGKAIVLGRIEDGQLAGYAAGRIDEAGAGYIDFVGVTATRRRGGHGSALVVAISRALHTCQPVPRVSLTVSAENTGALALYDTLGFRRTSSAVGYRRRPS